MKSSRLSAVKIIVDQLIAGDAGDEVKVGFYQIFQARIFKEGFERSSCMLK